MDLKIHSESCGFSYGPATCDTDDGGQYCLGNDQTYPTDVGEVYYLEPGPTSRKAILSARFWDNAGGAEGNLRLEVHYGTELVQTVYAQNVDNYR